MIQPTVARRRAISTTESPWIQAVLIAIALVFIVLFLVLPLAAVFAEALGKGLGAYWLALLEPDAWAAIRLTLLTAVVAVPLNLVFGVAAAWAIAKSDFLGKSLLLQRLYDLPFSVSPIVAGLIYVLVFGARVIWAMACREQYQDHFCQCLASFWQQSLLLSRSLPRAYPAHAKPG
jgi:sulfate transport system permease protein